MSRHDYFAFGEEATSPPGNVTHQLAGHERDRETGMDYMMARYYADPLGRFISVDPVAKSGKSVFAPQRWNRYTYSLNNPLKYFDPDGKDAVTSLDTRAKTITITVNVVLAGGTARQASKFQDDANSKWSGSASVIAKDGSKWAMTVKVNATNDPTKFSATDKPNTLQVGESGGTEMTSASQGTLNSNDLANPSVAGHETGHMMGLSDQYDKSTEKPLPGKDGSMMGDPKNPDAKPTQDEKNEVGQKALQAVEKKDMVP